MNLLEQPMEAVAFRIYSLPEVASAAWTCLAAVLAAAAAAGLWRLRSSTPADFTVAATKQPLQLHTSPLLTTSTDEAGRSSSDQMPPPAPSPKERYRAYYHDSARVGCCVVESDEEEEEDRDREDDDGDDDVHGRAWATESTDPFEWEQVVRPLMATATTDEMAGRRYRSPRALSANVVRLWDQGLTAASPRWRRGTVSTF